MFAECSILPAQVLLALNEEKTLYHYAESIGCEKIKIFTKFSPEFIPPVEEDVRLTIRHLRLPGVENVLLAVVHFPSKRVMSDSSQNAESIELSNSIKRAEQTVAHSKTVLLGDLNMNPFQEGVVNANGLHGVMSRQIARQGTRTVQSRQYPFFYNPMWSLFGDATSGSPATYYRRNAEQTEFFWYMLDQVLIRPDLLDRFDNENLQILESDGETSFLSDQGLPNKNLFSDHLPLLLKLEL
ncbi:MAG: hypothetical protein Kow00121_59800 [Elainellaceae cyanobacterium]